MRFIDQFNKKEQRKQSKHRLKNCPYPKDCSPCSWAIGKNRAGVCAGLIHTMDNLDCIYLCIFYREAMDSKTKKVRVFDRVKVTSHFMTPDEAIEHSRVLLDATKTALDFSSDYQKHYKYLNKIRA
jgi:hypothetical protein